MSIRPSQTAVEVGAALIDADDLQQQVMAEAAATNEESGRTICGPGDTREPMDTAFDSVKLPACPANAAGRLMHGGGGHNFFQPRHSLPDMANVLFEGVQASLVVGTRTSDLMLSPATEDRDDAVGRFQEALGVDATSTEEVIVAIQEGLVRPRQARQQTRRKLPLLFRRVSTPLAVPKPLTTPRRLESVVALAIQNPTRRVNDTLQAIRVFFAEVFDFDLSQVNINLPQLLVGEVANALVLALFLALLGGTPTGMVG